MLSIRKMQKRDAEVLFDIALLMIEKLYPKVKRWKLDTLAENYGLHRFYESLGYIKTGEMEDKKKNSCLCKEYAAISV